MEPHLSSVASVIQLAVAPVFLLTAIGALLGVMTNRVARAIDRARVVAEQVPLLEGEARAATVHEFYVLSRRVRWANRAITYCTTCAVLICLEVTTLFVGAFLAVDLSNVAGTLFVLALVALTVGLLALLREVYLATRNLRIGADTFKT
jgi:hypothetical protein